jgi:chromosome segregation ATPase
VSSLFRRKLDELEDMFITSQDDLLARFSSTYEENARLKQSLRLQIEQNALAQVGFKMYQDNVDSGGLHKDRKDAIARLESENARLKAECQDREAWNNVLAVKCDSLKAEVERLQSIHNIDSIGIEQLKAEVERLTSDIQMEKENEDRLVREWQKANNEVYGLNTQVAALIDDQTRLKAEVERLTKAGDLMCRMAGNNQVINRHWKTAKKGVQS